VVVIDRCHHLSHEDVGGFLLPGGEIIFIVYIMEVGQGSGSSERMGGYGLFIFLLYFIFQIVHIIVVHPCCFRFCSEYVSYVFYLYPMFVSAIRYMLYLLVSLVQSSRFICCCPYVLVVMFHRFTCCFMLIAVMIHMPCLVIMFHILCFHAFNNNMLHMLIDRMFHIAMDMSDIIIL